MVYYESQCVVNDEVWTNTKVPLLFYQNNGIKQKVNPFEEPCHVLECQFGEECVEDDIEREAQGP